jgi:hypothetical protein
MNEIEEIETSDTSDGRLQRFAEIYKAKMATGPFMEILARYDSMTEAGLLVGEREKADLYLDTHRFNELLYPGKVVNVQTPKPKE